MGRIALLLLIVAALVTFALQNQTPIALVVLGTRTLSVPLGIWVLGALGAGAFTTLLLTGFFSLSKAGAVRRAAQRLSDAGSRSPWGGMGTKRGAEASGPRARETVGFKAADRRSEGHRRSTNDDWEQSDIDRETWDDWGEPAARPPQSSSRTNIRDTADDTWARWDDNRPDDRRTEAPRREPRTEFSARPPVDRHREDDLPERNSERKNGVYDAEYRVLVPPYGSQPAPVTPPPAPNPPPQPAPEPDPLDDDDWGLDDLDPKK